MIKASILTLVMDTRQVPGSRPRASPFCGTLTVSLRSRCLDSRAGWGLDTLCGFLVTGQLASERSGGAGLGLDVHPPRFNLRSASRLRDDGRLHLRTGALRLAEQVAR